MARTHGARAYSPAEKQYIKDNWMTNTDQDIALHIGRGQECVSKYRRALGLTRYEYSLKLNSTKALICELHVSGKSMEHIQAVVGKRPYDISKVLIKCLSVIPLTDRSKVVVLKSKV